MSDSEDTVIRASSLSGYADCNRRGAARMFRREIEAAGYRLRELPRGIGAAVGTAAHEAARVVLAEKARSGSLAPQSVAIDCAEQNLKEAIADGVEYDQASGNKDTALRQVSSMVSSYHRVVAPQINPIMVESRLEMQVRPGLVVSGTPDLVAHEPHGIEDLKTSGRPVPGYHAPQVGAYMLLARSNGIVKQVLSAALSFVRRVRPDKPQPDPVRININVAVAETAAANLVRRIHQDLTVFREGDQERSLLPGDPWAFLPNPGSNMCSARWCEAWGTDFCRDHGSGKEESY